MATTFTNSTASLAASDPDGVLLSESSGKSGFYGKVPVVQRPYSSAVHATSAISSSTDFGATQLAWAQEVTNTFIGLGIWATV
ncbi:MAG TPA: hypothetical protein VF077_13340 [Nitrospiraceae bacterium]